MQVKIIDLNKYLEEKNELKMKVKIAATQMSCDWEIENNLNKAIEIETAAQRGANIILLQELFLTPILHSI